MLDCPSCPLAAARLGVPPPHAVPARIVGESAFQLPADRGQTELGFVEQGSDVCELLT